MSDQVPEDLKAAVAAAIKAMEMPLASAIRNETDEILAAEAASVPPKHRPVWARWLMSKVRRHG